MAEKERVPDDTFARDSFGMRRMTQGQVWAMTIVAVLVMVGLLVYANL
jgi:hypothetical protein